MTMHVSLPMSLEVMSYALVFRTSCYHCWEKTNSWCMINNDETMGKPQVFGLQTIFLTSSLLVCGEHSNGGRSVTIYQTIFIQRRPWCIALMTHLCKGNFHSCIQVISLTILRELSILCNAGKELYVPNGVHSYLTHGIESPSKHISP
jgi:hypothetical protein